jgi:hypothetical protein
MAMKMKRRIERLERAVPPPPPDETLQQKRWEKVLDRFLRLVEQAATLLSPNEEQRVAQALVDPGDGDGRRGPYAGWLRDLQHGWCRLHADHQLGPVVGEHTRRSSCRVASPQLRQLGLARRRPKSSPAT